MLKLKSLSIRLFSLTHANPSTQIDPYKLPVYKPLKTPLQYIADVKPIEIENKIAICDGKHEGFGHPIQFLQLDRKISNSIETCKYCGLRFKMKDGYVPSSH